MAKTEETKKAETKKATKRTTKKKAETVTYRDQQYTVLEKNEHKYKLTDGTIHFWAKVEDVKAE